MFSRSAWEPRWKYQVGRQHLCMNAAAEAALEGEWFDEKQPAPPEPPPEPPPERIKRKYVKRARPFALREADMRLEKTWKLANLTQSCTKRAKKRTFEEAGALANRANHHERLRREYRKSEDWKRNPIL